MSIPGTPHTRMMNNNKRKRIALAIVAALAILAGVAVLGLHVATKELKHQVEQALGANSEVDDIVVGWSAIEVRGVRIRAPQGWPAPDTLRAQRVVIVPIWSG